MINGSEQTMQLSPLKRALLALERMQAKLEAAERARSEPVAVVGVGCRLPGADNLEMFWQLLRNGIDAVTDIPPDRWAADAYYDPDPDAPGKMSTRRGAFLRHVDLFDPQFFGIAPREAVSMDPQQRLLLEVAWEAFEHGGIAPDTLAGSRTGVFIGVTTGDYAQLQRQSSGLASLDAYYASGSAHSIASGRLSYTLGLQGPSVTLDTACSSSLVAVHLAVQSLRAGESQIALAGGVNLILSPENGIALSKYRMLAPDGRCKTFDALADGFVRGEGCALVVLKRLSDALADDDRVLAVIRGSAVNQDGPSSGLTAPNGPAQEAVIREALANGGVAPHEVGYVEAHGTGTALGDPIEVQALAAALRPGRVVAEPLAIGSVKTNIGHLEAVAGVAGLIKALLVLQHGEIPPHLHLHEPSPHIDWAQLPIVVPTTRTPWRPTSGRRVAGVSSFGFSGTNAHIVLEEAPLPAQRTAVDDRSPHTLALSAKSASALRARAGQLAAHLGANLDLPLADVCHTENAGRAHFAHRLAIVTDSTARLHADLAAVAAGHVPANAVCGHVTSDDPPKIAFLFTGQGAQYPGMARQLYAIQPVFRAALDRCAQLLTSHVDRPLLEVMFDETSPDATHLLLQTSYTQPALFALEYALAELWRSWGITPQAVLGHSVGEYVAAVLAGVFSLEDGLRLVASRSQLMQGLPAGGAMAAVFASPDQVRAAVAPHAARLSVAAINGPDHAVISGDVAAVEQVASSFAAAGVAVQRLKVSHAFHSPLMEPMLAAFAEVAAGVTYAPPQLRLISNLTGGAAGSEVAAPAYWVRHIRETVRFADGIAALQQQGYGNLVEIGPHPVLLGLARQCVSPDAGARFPSLRRGCDDWRQLMSSLAGLYAAGARIEWAHFDAPYGRRKLDLPTYPFERQRYWAPTRRPTPEPAAQPGSHPLLGQRLRSPLTTASFEARISTGILAYLNDHRVFGSAVLPATAFLEAALAAASRVVGASTLEDTVIHEALTVGEDEVRTMQTIVTPEANGASFQIFSQGEGEETWKLHVTARAHMGQGNALTAARLDDIRARCREEVTDESHYALLYEHGLDFGPSLRGVRCAWKGEGEVLGEIALPERHVSEVGHYGFHPALLDACIQILAEASASGGAAYLPISIDRVTLRDSPDLRLWSHAVLRRGPSPSEQPETLSADVYIYTAEGAPIGAVEGLHLKRAGREALQRLGERERSEDWLYKVAWRPQPLAEGQLTSRQASVIPAIGVIATSAATHIEQLHATHAIDHYQSMLDGLEALSTDYIVLALGQLGLPFIPGTRFSVAHLDVAERHRALLARLLRILVEDGVLRQGDDAWDVVRAPQVGDTAACWTRLMERYPAGRGALTIARRCGEQLAEALGGRVDPLALLFPGGSIEDAEHMYQESPFARFYNSLVGETISAAVAQLPEERPVRVLEIGAGTGGTSAYVLPRLPANRAEYTFTDISPHFLHKARRTFTDYPFITYRTLDIEVEPETQGFGDQQFDLVIAANVLHATADLRRTLAHVARLLTPGGVLVLLEMIRPQRFIDISFGLTEGWWSFTDTDVRPSSPLLSREQWLSVLTDSGFREPMAVADPRTDGVTALSLQGILVAGAPDQTATFPMLPDGQRDWLILADRGGMGERLADLITARGGRAVVAFAGAAYRKLDAQRYELNPANVDDFARLLREAPACMGIVYLWALDLSLDHDMLHAAQEQSCGGALHLTQALLRSPIVPRLCLVTRGAQPVATAATNPSQAPLWGLGKTIELEHPALRCICIDLEPGVREDVEHELLETVLAPDDSNQIALRAGMRYAARLARTHIPPDVERALRLELSGSGTLDEMSLRPLVRRAPGPGEVEIRVHAAGLNFRDVMNALAMRGDPQPVGSECAGIVVAVGLNVSAFAPGDAVIAVAPGSFSSYATTSVDLVAAKPAHLSFEEAATIPLAFLTAYYALDRQARVRAGETVLVHAAAGGVGLAAIQLARRAGAEVMATAGSERKRRFLRALGVRHVFSSRTLDFSDEVRVATGGRGVDVVLNSLIGEFIPRGLDTLATGGRFVELGKRDIWDDSRVAAFRPDVSYFMVPLAEDLERRPEVVGPVLRDLIGQVAAGTLNALPYQAFELEQAPHAFRYMAQARHIGKVVLTQPEAAEEIEGTMAGLRPDATYLITGGLSGLGLLVAEWMVAQGARNLVLMARSAPSAPAQATLRRLRQSGAQVSVAHADVAQREQVEAVLASIEQSMPPLRGIVHSAGILDDAALVGQDWDRFARVMAPKVSGTWHLHTLSLSQRLDFFVLFSSAASLLGARGQANHAAANAFMDALAFYRRARGLPALSINWGAWSTIGAASESKVGARIATQGMRFLTPSQGLAVLDMLIRQGQAQIGVLPMDWTVFRRQFHAGSVSAWLSEIVPQEPQPTRAAPVPASDVRTLLAEAQPAHRPRLLLDFVSAQAVRVLGTGVGQDIDERQPLRDLGLDSLMAIELRNLLDAGLGLTRPLPATLVFDYPTVEALARYLAKEILDQSEAEAEREEETAKPLDGGGRIGRIADMLASLEDLSDEDVDRLLLDQRQRSP